MASNENGKPGTLPGSAYEAAIAVATDQEKERLQALRLRFNVPPDSPEWQFYAILAPLTGSGSTEKALADFAERLERVEQGVADIKKPKASSANAVPAIPAEVTAQLGRMEERQKEQTRVLESLTRRNGKPSADPIAEMTRYVMAFAVALLVYVATAVIGAGRQPMLPFVGWVGAFAIGILATLAYQRLAPMIKGGR